MSVFPTRRQWFVVIIVNILISAITTILVVRVITRPADGVDTGAVRSSPPAVTSAASTATPVSADAATRPVALAPTLAPAPTATKPAPSPTAVQIPAPDKVLVTISNVNFPGQRQRESVVIANEGDTVELKGWTLASTRGAVYTFPNVTLFKDSFINVYTTAGTDVATDLFMNRTEAAWQVGDTVTLARNGQPVTTYTIKP